MPSLHLRIPSWCREAALQVNGDVLNLGDVTHDGYAAIRRTWRQGDRVNLDLKMSVDRLHANPEVRQDVGRVALARGPLIYCVEETDNKGQLHRIVLPATATIEAHDRPDLLGGVVTLSAVAGKDVLENWESGLYRTDPPGTDATKLTAVPYFARDNREPGEMLVWLRGS